jgi:methylphosphotriester-DNA--protein-cysteine methyltransferase
MGRKSTALYPTVKTVGFTALCYKRYNGKFYLAVRSTKIVCNPGCPSRVPLEKNMVFFDKLSEALDAGYRPCKICMKEYWKTL